MLMGRQTELKKLESAYNSGKFECVILYGRWRVGKTALLREFIKTKKAIYFAAQETSGEENLKDFIYRIEALPREPEAQAQPIDSFDGAFEHIFRLALDERILLIIDDYQFLAGAHKGISDLICGHIDRRDVSSKLMIVICGSSRPAMEKEALGYSSPFHGRRTAQLELRPFTFFEARRHYSGFSSFDIAVLFGVTGGVPKYIGLMDPALPVEENIRRVMFDPSSFLFEEPLNILRSEVRDPAYYNAILRAIAAGFRKNSEIASTVGLETSACTMYLKNLITLGVVGKHTPMTEKAGKKTIYDIEDSMFRFWYRFVPKNMSLIKGGMASRIWRDVARDIPSFMGKVFEDICRQWLEQQNQARRLPASFVEFGRWWGYDPVWKSDTSLPIVAYADESHAIFGDCVWSDEPAQSNALVSLVERSRLFRYPNKHLYLFSRSGFSEECAEAAQRVGANLVMFE